MLRHALICALAPYAVMAAYGPAGDAGMELLDLPRPFVDPDHPRPKWVDDLASKSRSSAKIDFRRLDAERQLEFAVFMALDQHPADLEWGFILAQQGEEILPLLERSVSRDASDRFALGVMQIVYIVAAKHGLAGEPTIYGAMRARVNRIVDPTRKWNAQELLARIARDDRRGG